MKTNNTKLFTSVEVSRIEEAVRLAEQNTSGEIVPFVVSKSDDYEEAEWRGGFICVLVFLAVVLALHEFTDIWFPFEWPTIVFAGLLTGIMGILVVKFIPAVKRLTAGQSLMEERVGGKAAEAFLSEEIFQTRDRTGILLFLSLLERRVVVVGDSGINEMVEKGAWGGIVDKILNGIRSGRAADGLVDAIEQSGKLLKQHGLSVRPDDKDELSNSFRQR
ncbi:MAG TPA: hypothetical protein VGB89_03505 [Bacteroidota bacterium]